MKKGLMGLCLLVVGLCIGCGIEEPELVKNDSLKDEVLEVLDKASYENLEIQFDDIDNLDGQEIVIANARYQRPSEGLSYEEAVKLYATEIYPKLLDMETLDTGLIYDIETHSEDGPHRVRTYEKNYDDILATIDTYEKVPQLVYANNDTWTELYNTNDWLGGVYISQGKLGSMRPGMGVFFACGIIEDVKKYDCRLDDLSDSYLIMDGEKTVTEAKQEIEAYLDAHYPLVGDDNDIHNVVYKIIVGKISGTEYYAFQACRTLSYNGIPFREMPTKAGGIGPEVMFMGESVMCESNKLDVTKGLINCYTKPVVERVITEFIPFQEVMDRVAYYLTGETKFQLLSGSLEYRVYEQEDVDRFVPYWCFVAKNPNDDKMLKIYVDMETGETESFAY